MLKFRDLISIFTLPALIGLAFSCTDKGNVSQEESKVPVVIDSTYYTMNPMDLHFDSTEQVMIDSGMADLVNAYREIR